MAYDVRLSVLMYPPPLHGKETATVGAGIGTAAGHRRQPAGAMDSSRKAVVGLMSETVAFPTLRGERYESDRGAVTDGRIKRLRSDRLTVTVQELRGSTVQPLAALRNSRGIR